jgi:glycine cleavage system transcriptional repressor
VLGNLMTNQSAVSIAIATLGTDKPGLVAGVAQAITLVKGNIVDSTMTRLAGQFAMILLVELPSVDCLLPFKQALLAYEHQFGLQCQVQVLPASVSAFESLEKNETKAGGRLYLLSVAGNDRTGITHEVSQLLASFQANITDLNAHRINGEDGAVYILVLELECPAEVPHDTLETALNQLGQKLELEVRLRSIDPVSL